jgi:hypothetical protein
MGSTLMLVTIDGLLEHRSVGATADPRG